jgi:N utilization substance protein B
VGARSKARKRALDVLYEAELKRVDPLAVVRERVDRGDETPLPQYAVELVEIVREHREELDELLATSAEGWSVERMPTVDRNALRIGLGELLYRDDVPDAVAISEAVALVKTLSTDESPRFVNAVLDRVARVRKQLA